MKGRNVFALFGIPIACFFIFGCGDEDKDACQQAAEKWNVCQKSAALNSGKKYFPLSFDGECNDQAKSAKGTVAFRSWSEQYLKCTPDPTTCLCPYLSAWYDYTKK